jgi:hypothetical protein
MFEQFSNAYYPKRAFVLSIGFPVSGITPIFAAIERERHINELRFQENRG